MLRSLYIAASGMEAQELQMDIISNNLANVSTAGFKKTRAEFEDLLTDTVRAGGTTEYQGGSQTAALEVGLGVRTTGTARMFSQGDMQNTNNPLDLAIQGSGFFRVQRPNGELAYTRAGNFRSDSTGRIVTPNGEILQPQISIPSDATSVTIQSDGTVLAQEPGRTQPTALGTLDLAMFQNPGGLASVGGNLLTPTVASGDPVVVKSGEQGAGTFAQGYLEGANVQAVEEMVSMISTQHSYELNSKVIQTVDQMLGRLTTIR
jgi:flagellar basal-body rod protein FlgG